jgi:hypothetical protein
MDGLSRYGMERNVGRTRFLGESATSKRVGDEFQVDGAKKEDPA